MSGLGDEGSIPGWLIRLFRGSVPFAMLPGGDEYPLPAQLGHPHLWGAGGGDVIGHRQLHFLLL